MQNFQILIVSAVKICKQCVQTHSVSGGLWHPTEASPLNPTPDPMLYSPQQNIAKKLQHIENSIHVQQFHAPHCFPEFWIKTNKRLQERTRVTLSSLSWHFQANVASRFSKLTVEHMTLHRLIESWKTYQSAIASTQAGIFQPCSKIILWRKDQGANLQ